jgi:hypothetical protein
MSIFLSKWIVIFFFTVTVLLGACDTTTIFNVSGNIAICTVSGPAAPFVKVRFYRFQKDTIISPKYKKDIHGKGYLDFPLPADTVPEYSVTTDEYGSFKVCPFDSGVYRIEMEVELQDSLRLNKFEKSGYCIPKLLTAAIPQMQLNSKHHHYSYAFVNDLDRVDDTSCCKEFKKIYSNNNCKQYLKKK